MNHDELYQLIILLCPDFSERLTLQVYKTLIFSDPSNQTRREWMERAAVDTSKSAIRQQQTYELPTFAHFRIALRTYFLYFEFLEMLFDEVFQKSYLLPVSMTTFELKTIKICKEATLMIFDPSNYNATSSIYFCVPATEKLQKVFQRIRVVDEDHKTNFSHFCGALYQEIVANKNDVIVMMDEEFSSISSIHAQKQYARMRKYVSKIGIPSDPKSKKVDDVQQIDKKKKKLGK